MHSSIIATIILQMIHFDRNQCLLISGILGRKTMVNLNKKLLTLYTPPYRISIAGDR